MINIKEAFVTNPTYIKNENNNEIIKLYSGDTINKDIKCNLYIYIYIYFFFFFMLCFPLILFIKYKNIFYFFY